MNHFLPTPGGMIRWFAGVFLLLASTQVFSQSKRPIYQNSRFSCQDQLLHPVTGSALAIPLPPVIANASSVKKAGLTLQLDLGEENRFADIALSVTADFSLQALQGISAYPLCKQACRFTLSNVKPEEVYYYDFKSFSNGTRTFENDPSIFEKFNVTINQLTVTVDPSNKTKFNLTDQQLAQLKSTLESDIRLSLRYEIEYGINAQNASVSGFNVAGNGVNTTGAVDSKVVTFNWSNFNYYPNFQFQLLRLYNREMPSDPALKQRILAEEAIITEVDWTKALTLETQSSASSLRLTIAEGAGYYIWRVRPIGTAQEGGIANSTNFGTWPASIPGETAGKITLERSRLANVQRVFYFSDPDEGINTIYSRTFTEGNRVSEKVGYASSLQQLKQNQTYLPSQKTRVITQNVYDYSNRPALSTLPAPVEDTIGLRGYQRGFLKPLGKDSIYRDRDFDKANNLHKPTPVQPKGALDYYSGKGNVADAEGYPFTRSVYYNDGTNRVKEQSGVGKRHMLGDTTQQMGRTVKTYYGTASETELVRLFGDEAPSAESVIKTITLDQNSTATVTYTSKEGKVIATSMAFQSQGRLSKLDSLAPAQIMIRDAVTEQSASNQALVGSKRLAFTEPTPLTIEYKMSPCTSTTQDCATTSLDCQYSLLVLVSKLDGEAFKNIPLDASQTGGSHQWAFLPAQGTLTADSTVLYSMDTTVSCATNALLRYPTLRLPTGTYTVEKRLVLRGQNIVVSAAQEKTEKMIMPLAHLITGMLDSVKCNKDMDKFLSNLRTLEKNLKAAHTACQGADSCAAYRQLDATYKISSQFFNSSHVVEVYPKTGIPLYVALKAGCCDTMRVPISMELPIFDYKRETIFAAGTEVKVNPFLLSDTTKTQFLPDFEGYAYEFFKPCITTEMASKTAALPFPDFLQGASTPDANKIKYIYHEVLKPVMKGWETPGTFNLMIHHMLRDQYSCDGSVKEHPETPEDPCEPTPPSPCDSSGKCFHYNGEDLFNCWTNQLVYLKNQLQLCPDPISTSIYGDAKPPYSVSNALDSEKGDDGTFHNSHIDDNLKMGWFLKFFMKKKIKKASKRIRNQQVNKMDEEDDGGDLTGESPIAVVFNYHLVKEFLGCSGYRFAKILTNTPNEEKPLEADAVAGITYQVPAPSTTTWKMYTGTNRGYQPDSSWKVLMGADANAERLFGPVKDPVYAFKYFEYVDESMPEIEIGTCYSDPNYFVENGQKVYLCPTSKDSLCNFCGIGRIRCAITKEQWTCGQRYAFFAQAEKYKRTQPIDWRDDGLVPEDFMAPGYVEGHVDTAKFIAWDVDVTKEYTTTDYAKLETDQFKLDTTKPRLLAKVEADIIALNRGVDNTCELKRATFKQTLIDTLRARCYIIGGCKLKPDDNIIPLEDIDLLVDAMVGECKKRGLTTTFTTVSDSCRNIFAPKARSHMGHVDKEGKRIEYNTLEYGAGSMGDVNCQLVTLYYRTSQDGTNGKVISSTLTATANDTLTAISTYDASRIVIRRCSGSTLSFEEYYHRKEVMETTMFIDIQSKCLNNTAPLVCAPASGITSPNPDPTVVDNSVPTEQSSQGIPKRSASVSVTVDINEQGKLAKPKP